LHFNTYKEENIPFETHNGLENYPNNLLSLTFVNINTGCFDSSDEIPDLQTIRN